jgi:RTX calcium-binding nonapeptide repeat (4 copies)
MAMIGARLAGVLRARSSARLAICLALGSAAVAALPVAPAGALTSHDGWPKIDGMLLMNKVDQSRPLDARVGQDPFDGQDDLYQCDGLHFSQSCFVGEATCETEATPEDPTAPEVPAPRRKSRSGPCARRTVIATKHHNELLGGHRNDVIHGGANGDVIWGDYKEDSAQPTDQRDSLFGGDGRDFIYASHGRNDIHAGGGKDYVKAHFGRGSIDCGGGADVLYISRKAQRKFSITGCETISHKTLGF